MLTKTKKFVDFQNCQKSNFNEGKFLKFDHSKTFHGVMRDPTKNLGPIGSAVLTFIGYKQKTDRQAKFIYRRPIKNKNVLKCNQITFLFSFLCIKRELEDPSKVTKA